MKAVGRPFDSRAFSLAQVNERLTYSRYTKTSADDLCKYDTWPPMEQLKRLAATNLAFGSVLHTAADIFGVFRSERARDDALNCLTQS